MAHHNDINVFFPDPAAEGEVYPNTEETRETWWAASTKRPGMEVREIQRLGVARFTGDLVVPVFGATGEELATGQEHSFRIEGYGPPEEFEGLDSGHHVGLSLTLSLLSSFILKEKALLML